MYKVLGIGWGWMLVLCILFPFLGVIIQFVFLLSTMYSDVTLTFPIILLPLFLIIGIYLWWLWVIGIEVNKRMLVENKLENQRFKKALYWCTAALFASLIYLGVFDFLLEIENIIPGWINTLLAFFLVLVMISVAAALVYAAYFVGNVLKEVLKEHRLRGQWHDTIPLFIKVLAFPLGMPILNKELNEIL